MSETEQPIVTQRLEAARRVVVKIGTSLIDHEETRFNHPLISGLARQIKELRERDIDVVLVSSGAVGAGMRAMGVSRYPASMAQKQALAAIGQPFLMHQYGDVFEALGLRKAQLLLTRDGLENRLRYLHARDCLEELLRMGVVPIINENDTVVVDELRFGDNDQLSAIVAAKIQADVLVILTDVDGLYSGNPRTDPDATLIPVVSAVKTEMLARSGELGSVASTGGMKTKLLAARLAGASGVLVGITNGFRENCLLSMLSGAGLGTWFLPGTHTPSGRKRWMTSRRPNGDIVIDPGAVRALVRDRRSLLPVGVKGVVGTFQVGDLVRILTDLGDEVGLGIIGFSAAELDRIKGHSSDRLQDILGRPVPVTEVVHRDNLVLVGGEEGV